jgi:hypothetical protein
MKTANQEKETSSRARRFKVAVVQAVPVVFDRERTLERVHVLSGEAARKDARLVLFPEAFVSAFPRGFDFGAVIGSRSEGGREDFRRYWESSVDVPSPAVDALSRTARSHSVYLVVGVVERERGTLYCSVLFFAPDGNYLGKHRKVMLPSGCCGVLAMAAVRKTPFSGFRGNVTLLYYDRLLGATTETCPTCLSLQSGPCVEASSPSSQTLAPASSCSPA